MGTIQIVYVHHGKSSKVLFSLSHRKKKRKSAPWSKMEKRKAKRSDSRLQCHLLDVTSHQRFKQGLITFGQFLEHYEVTRFRVLRWRRNTNDGFLLWTSGNFDVHKSPFEATSSQLLFKSANWPGCMRRQFSLLRHFNHWLTKSLALVS